MLTPPPIKLSQNGHCLLAVDALGLSKAFDKLIMLFFHSGLNALGSALQVFLRVVLTHDEHQEIEIQASIHLPQLRVTLHNSYGLPPPTRTGPACGDPATSRILLHPYSDRSV